MRRSRPIKGPAALKDTLSDVKCICSDTGWGGNAQGNDLSVDELILSGMKKIDPE